MWCALFRLLFLLCAFAPLVLAPCRAAAATSHSIHVEWGYTPPSVPAVSGFNLYQEGTRVCQTASPTATTLDCTVLLTAERTYFTLTASFSDGTESPHSAPYPFDLPQVKTNTAQPSPALEGFDQVYYLKAKLALLQAEPATAAAWAGKDTVFLEQVIKQHGYTPESHYLTYGYKEGLAPNAYFRAPEYTLAKAADLVAKGHSTTIQAALAAFAAAWPLDPYQHYLAYGDAEGLNPSSSFDRAAYLTQKLAALQADPATRTLWVNKTVADVAAALTAAGLTTLGHYLTYGITEGLSASAVAAPSQGYADALATETASAAAVLAAGTAPNAVVTTSVAAGPAPLTVTFSAAGSTGAADAAITAYAWDFGDGSSATGPSTAHTFTTAGTYRATLSVTGNAGLVHTVHTPIVVTAAAASSSSTAAQQSFQTTPGSPATVVVVSDGPSRTSRFALEAGEVQAGPGWRRVPLATAFTRPIVVAGRPNCASNDPCAARLRNIDPSGFDIRLSEMQDRDGNAPAATVSYLVMERGRTASSSGANIEAGSFADATGAAAITFSKPFAQRPVVLTIMASAHGTGQFSGGVTTIERSGFHYAFASQASKETSRPGETVNFIAWEPGAGTIGSLQFLAAMDEVLPATGWQSRVFQPPFKRVPLVLADRQNSGASDAPLPALQAVTSAGFQVRLAPLPALHTVGPPLPLGYLAIGTVSSP